MILLGSLFTTAWADPGAEPQDGPDPDEDELPIVTHPYLWLGETKVTAANAGDILGDGTVSFHIATNTLRFAVREPAIRGSHAGTVIDGLNLTGLSIEAPEGLVIQSDSAVRGICLENGGLAVNTSELKLALSSADAQYGILAGGDVQASGSIAVSAPGEKAIGISSGGTVTVSAGEWDVTGGKQAILAKDGIRFPESFGVAVPENGKLVQTEEGYTVSDETGTAARHVLIKEQLITIRFVPGFEDLETLEIRIPRGGTVASLPALAEHGEAPNVWKPLGWFTEPAQGTELGKLGERISAETSFREDSTVYAQWYLPGDVDGSGLVNGADALALARCLRYGDLKVVEPALDTNGDGAVNNLDVTRLLRSIRYKDVGIN